MRSGCQQRVKLAEEPMARDVGFALPSPAPCSDAHMKHLSGSMLRGAAICEHATAEQHALLVRVNSSCNLKSS